MYKKRKQAKLTVKDKSYRFWNCGIEYICKITSPTSIPDYRIKEVFDRTFVGKRNMSVVTKPMAFSSLSQDIDYIITPVKEAN